MARNPIPNVARGLLIGMWMAGLVWLECRNALRPERKSKLERDVRNLLIAAPAGLVMQAIEMPLALKLAEVAQTKRWGLLPRIHTPGVLGIALLDYTLYWWHFLTHRVPLLWRFHQVHHLDQEMDATTGLRFHFGEMIISIAFRSAQIVLIGPTVSAVAAWQVFLFLCVLFHHSNVRLPLHWERRLARFVITPRLHGIHHSVVADEVNSNWSSGLTVWDWLHATLRTEIPQDRLVLGVRGLSDPGVGASLALPFHFAGERPMFTGQPVREPLDQLA